MKYAVYGTLRLNQGNYNWCLRNKSEHLKTEKLNGFKMYSVGGFPAVIEDENSSIEVDIFEVNDKNVEEDMDMLEGYNPNNPESSMYIKKRINDMYIYIWNGDVHNLELIESGNWLKKELV